MKNMALLLGLLLTVLCCDASPSSVEPERPPTRIRISASPSGPAVSPELYGLDLEFTRHDIFNGISSEMLANRKFTTLPQTTSGWPSEMNMLAGRGIGGAARWTGVGSAVLDAPYWRNESHLVNGDVGHSVRCDASKAPCGVEQCGWLGGFNSGKSFGSAIALEAGSAYVLRLVLRGGGKSGNLVSVSFSSSGVQLWTHTFVVPATSSGWVTVDADVATATTTMNATLRIASASSTAAWWLGSASLTRADTTPQQLRADVVAALKATNFRGPLRYPGGCFATFYRWKVGLLPADMRPPIATPPNYCAAVAGGVDGYTDGVVANGLGIDEYLGLVDELGAVPAITVRMVLGTDEEVTEARDWVEYVNGNASTPFGALRAKRLGHDEPYNVSIWYLGNEIFQVRCPNYPADPSNCIGGISAEDYAVFAKKFVRAMKAASPMPLRFVAANKDPTGPWIDAIGADTYAWSDHDGYYGQKIDFKPDALTVDAKAPRDVFVKQKLQASRDALNAAGASHIAVSADEWALGYPWLLDSNFSVVHGVYAAAFLGSVTRVASELNVAFTNYFEPINEGAIFVGPFGSQLTPAGEVMAMMARHAGGALASASMQDDDLDVLATVHRSTHAAAGTVLITVTNLVAEDALGPKPCLFTVDGSTPPPKQIVQVTLLEASGFAQNSTFHRATSSVALTEGGALELSVPPFSLLQFSLRLV